MWCCSANLTLSGSTSDSASTLCVLEGVDDGWSARTPAPMWRPECSATWPGLGCCRRSESEPADRGTENKHLKNFTCFYFSFSILYAFKNRKLLGSWKIISYNVFDSFLTSLRLVFWCSRHDFRDNVKISWWSLISYYLFDVGCFISDHNLCQFHP